jgi:multiple sugar transport system substrate-binding protein
MSRQPKLLFRTAGLLTVALAVSSCSGFSSGDDRSASSGSTKIQMMMWADPTQKALYEKSLKKFTADSGVQVEILTVPSQDYPKKVASMQQAGTLPDVFVCTNANSSFGPLVDRGDLYDFTGYLDKGVGQYKLDKDKFGPGYLDLFTRKGKVYGIPHEVNVNGVYYNKRLLKEAGVALPTADWTWNDLFADAERLTVRSGGKVTRNGMIVGLETLDNPLGTSMYAQSMGGEPMARQSVSWVGVTDPKAGPEFVDGASRFAAAVKQGWFTGPNFKTDTAVAAFTAGKVPLLYGGQWFTFFFGNGPKDEWGYVPAPKGTAGRVSILEAHGFCSPKGVRNPSAAWKTIAYMAEHGFNDAYAEIGVTPVAYRAGTGGFFTYMANKGKQDPGYLDVAQAVTTDIKNPTKSGTAFLDPWAAKAGDLQKAVWNPMLDGKTPVQQAVDDYIKRLGALAGG